MKPTHPKPRVPFKVSERHLRFNVDSFYPLSNFQGRLSSDRNRHLFMLYGSYNSHPERKFLFSEENKRV